MSPSPGQRPKRPKLVENSVIRGFQSKTRWFLRLFIVCIKSFEPWGIALNHVRSYNLHLQMEKVISASLNFGPNSFFLPRPQNQLFRLLELPKPFARPPLSSFRVTWQQFSLFLLYLFWLNLWKIILNYKKNHKIENPILLYSTWVDLCSEHII